MGGGRVNTCTPSRMLVWQVRVLYVRNLMLSTTEDTLQQTFSRAAGHEGCVERVKKLKDYAFIHFTERTDALRAMDALNGQRLFHFLNNGQRVTRANQTNCYNLKSQFKSPLCFFCKVLLPLHSCLDISIVRLRFSLFLNACDTIDSILCKHLWQAVSTTTTEVVFDITAAVSVLSVEFIDCCCCWFCWWW